MYVIYIYIYIYVYMYVYIYVYMYIYIYIYELRGADGREAIPLFSAAAVFAALVRLWGCGLRVEG